MSVAFTKLRIASRRNFDKSDVESVYGELVRVIGGTYFIGGVAQGPANGLMDFRNFTVDAGIPNANKANPESLWPAQIALKAYTAPTLKSTFLALPWENIGIFPPFSGSVTALTLAYSTMTSGVNSGVAAFFIVRQGTSIPILPTFPWTNALAAPIGAATLGSVAIAPVALQPRDVLRMDFTNNVNTVGIVGIVWITSLHVK